MAILVPSESEESRFEIASSLTLLAMTEKGTPRNDKRRVSVTNHMNQYNCLENGFIGCYNVRKYQEEVIYYE